MRALCEEIIDRKPGARIYNSRVAKEILASTGTIGQLAISLLGSAALPVRALMFDKSPDSNWSLGWHQDRTIAVRERIDLPGYGPWSIKSGAVHVEPPFEMTSRMITMRLHLDDIDIRNAPLLIVPGSHALGRLPGAEIAATVARLGTYSCLAKTGDVWLYATPILHASDAAQTAKRRRVLQVDFSADRLPGGLNWLGIGD